VNWRMHIQRMRWIVNHWRKLDWVDHEFLLRKIKTEYPESFWKVANER
jgi:hypothetical protein